MSYYDMDAEKIYYTILLFTDYANGQAQNVEELRQKAINQYKTNCGEIAVNEFLNSDKYKDNFEKYRKVTEVSYDFILNSIQNDTKGIQCIYEFENGYGASLIRTPLSYGGMEGLWELALTKFDPEKNEYVIIYNDDFPDVRGYLTWDEAQFLLKKIQSYERIDNDSTTTCPTSESRSDSK